MPENSSNSATGLKAIKRLSMADEVASQVRSAIIAGEIPEGSPISEIQLAERLQVSRVPVREALVELEHDGIVQFDHRGRCQVREFTHHDVEELVSLRINLEVMSAKLAAKHRSASDLAKLERNVVALKKEKDVTIMSRLDVEFHDLIMQASGHHRLLVCWRTIRTQFEVLLAKAHRWQKSQRIPVSDHALRGHLPILQAISESDPTQAGKAMLSHVREWGEWMPLIESTNTTPSS
ncbi:GntR family transcriptional regulator [Phragmitibacter flavus]|uniref:GntR family transcriptional regulator n=1 Tax=Phragmitibacter flavus TaxID=2576071 RepID=A0A5R8K7L8_9BACT|nr:GntR family transcriptional regulator [Phragmitibacter flavus]TLD68357.1 GntR family transcriptional regulator [Phragmitibacter flavus]